MESLHISAGSLCMSNKIKYSVFIVIFRIHITKFPPFVHLSHIIMETKAVKGVYLAPVAEVIETKCQGVLCASQLQPYNGGNWDPFKN